MYDNWTYIRHVKIHQASWIFVLEIYNITELYNPFIINSNIDVRPRRVEIILASMHQSLMSTLQWQTFSCDVTNDINVSFVISHFDYCCSKISKYMKHGPRLLCIFLENHWAKLTTIWHLKIQSMNYSNIRST